MSHFHSENLSHIHLTSSALRSFDEWHGDCKTTEHRLTMTLSFWSRGNPHDLSIKPGQQFLSIIWTVQDACVPQAPSPIRRENRESILYDQSLERRLLDNHIFADYNSLDENKCSNWPQLQNALNGDGQALQGTLWLTNSRLANPSGLPNSSHPNRQKWWDPLGRKPTGYEPTALCRWSSECRAWHLWWAKSKWCRQAALGRLGSVHCSNLSWKSTHSINFFLWHERTRQWNQYWSDRRFIMRF